MKIGIYLRLSMEDSSSSSITSQRQLALNYVENHFSGCKVEEYVDDGFSGTNFERPAIKKLLEDIKNGEINCIIVKDLSRFGRNYIEVGNYLEKVFPFLDIRFIAINDNYDSEKSCVSDIEIPFRNILYDFYSKDISKKILSSKQHKMKNGEFCSQSAPYGYIKNPNKKGELLIDDYPASIVKRIFSLIIDGKTTGDIAKTLNNEKILTPMQYKKGDLKQNVWTASAVRRMAKDERYTGKFIGGKIKRRIENDKKTILIPKENWVIVEDMLPIIVNNDDFTLANSMITGKSHNKTINLDKLFCKKIKCKNCGLLFQHKKRASSYYFCNTAKFADVGCCTGKIYEDELADKVLKILKKHLDLSENQDENINSKKKKAFEKQINEIYRKIEVNENKEFELYDKYAQKEISKEKYIKRKAVYENENTSHKRKITDLKRKLSQPTHIKIEKISRELIDNVIDTIWVDFDESIEIKFKYREFSGNT